MTLLLWSAETGCLSEDFLNEILGISDKGHPGALMFPGGYLDAKELPKSAATRELREEVGISIEDDDFKLLAMANRIQANQSRFVICFM